MKQQAVHMRLLIINPNTTAVVTARVAAAARTTLPGVEVNGSTGRFGAAYISSRASFAVAGHAALDCLAEHGAGTDAVLLACFGDPGLDALREVSPVPVIGLVEAACREASIGGRRFAIVTGGERWASMLVEMIHMRGLQNGLVTIHTVAPTGGQIAEDPDGALDLLASSCRDCAQRHGAEAVILGGAGLLGLAGRIQPRCDVPVICSVEAGFRASADALARRERGDADTVATPSVGLSPALTAVFETGRLRG
jgi:allantoin racemase